MEDRKKKGINGKVRRGKDGWIKGGGFVLSLCDCSANRPWAIIMWAIWSCQISKLYCLLIDGLNTPTVSSMHARSHTHIHILEHPESPKCARTHHLGFDGQTSTYKMKSRDGDCDALTRDAILISPPVTLLNICSDEIHMNCQSLTHTNRHTGAHTQKHKSFPQSHACVQTFTHHFCLLKSQVQMHKGSSFNVLKVKSRLLPFLRQMLSLYCKSFQAGSTSKFKFPSCPENERTELRLTH